METKPITKILETLELPSAQPITLRQPSEKQNATAQKRKSAWLDKWLKMKPVHAQINVLQNEVWNFCAAYAKQPNNGYRLIIHGENGTGKSHAAKAIFRWANRLAINLPLVHRADGEIGLSDSLFFNWPAAVDGFKRGDWYLTNGMMDCSLLILDDVGAEHDPQRFSMEKLYLALERRASKWTVITTNIAPENWVSRFERRLASRLFRNARHVSLADVPDFNTQ